MKLLIISGPYEADRLRKAAVSAGFEAVAVEPGESLSGWITASRPALIVMAPQMVHPDPEQALAKVRSVPRGRVPIFLVGDAADEARMKTIADGFFIRPVAPDELLERARAVLVALAKEGGNGARPRTKSGEVPIEGPRQRTKSGEVPIEGPRQRTKSGEVPVEGAAAREFTTQSGRTPRGGPQLGRPAVGLKPLKARAVAPPPRAPVPSRPASDASAMLAKLGASIDDLFDADLSSALETAPRVATAPEGEREFDDMPTDDRRQRSASDRRAALLARYALVEEGDYFEVLGIARDATAADVKRAYDRIARELAPDEIDPALARELGAKIDAIREVVGEALRVLGDERLRPRYQNSLS